MIKHEQEKYGWEFLFVAANIDAVDTAAQIGIRPEQAANYRQTGIGTRSVYGAVDLALARMRMDKPLGSEWKAELDDNDD